MPLLIDRKAQLTDYIGLRHEINNSGMQLFHLGPLLFILPTQLQVVHRLWPFKPFGVFKEDLLNVFSSFICISRFQFETFGFNLHIHIVS